MSGTWSMASRFSLVSFNAIWRAPAVASATATASFVSDAPLASWILASHSCLPARERARARAGQSEGCAAPRHVSRRGAAAQAGWDARARGWHPLGAGIHGQRWPVCQGLRVCLAQLLFESRHFALELPNLVALLLQLPVLLGLVVRELRLCARRVRPSDSREVLVRPQIPPPPRLALTSAVFNFFSSIFTSCEAGRIASYTPIAESGEVRKASAHMMPTLKMR